MKLEHYLLIMFLITLVSSKRHHHYHYHLAGNKTEVRSQKLLTTDDQKDEVETFNPYTKHNSGRHVCTSHKTVTHPIKTVQTFCKPTYKKYMQPCNDNQLCTGVKLVFETAYRDVISTKNTRQTNYVCCPGWVQITRNSHGCNRPSCSNPCQNGGTCVRPDTCQCIKGFKGRYCETVMDECRDQKPCDQICHNIPGGYKCDCRETFILQPDGTSCKKEDEVGPGIEARDLEYELLDKRLFKLESILNNVSDHTMPKDLVENINKKMESLTTDVNDMKTRMNDVETNVRDIRVMKNKISVLENKASKMDEVSKRQEKGFKIYNNRIYN